MDTTKGIISDDLLNRSAPCLNQTQLMSGRNVWEWCQWKELNWEGNYFYFVANLCDCTLLNRKPGLVWHYWTVTNVSTQLFILTDTDFSIYNKALFMVLHKNKYAITFLSAYCILEKGWNNQKYTIMFIPITS